jgi:Ser/Thr protein kinase RdoA (MazF antagonist)
VPVAGLFTPDLFSNPVVVFSDTDVATQETIFNAVTDAFGVCGMPSRLEKSGALEINSGNFKLQAENGVFLLKRLTLDSNGVALQEQQQQMTTWLHKHGSPVPEPLATNSGNYVFHLHDDQYLLAMRFIEGQFFSGQASGVKPLANAIGQLHGDLRRLPEEFKIHRQYPELDAVDRECFARLFAEPIDTLFPASEAALLSDNLNLLRRCWDQALDCANSMNGKPVEAIHIDLHPHNVLVQGDELNAIIDLDSIMRGPIEVMASFGAFKLLRQVACYESASEHALWLDTYLNELQRCLPELSNSRETLANFATMELCHRIGVILRNNLIDQNTQWNHVLEIQIKGLLETDVIFGR